MQSRDADLLLTNAGSRSESRPVPLEARINDGSEYLMELLWLSVQKVIKYITYFLPLSIAISPIALLLAYSSELSERLGQTGCTPSGEWVTPYSLSIWDPSRIFAITIAFTRPKSTSCKSYSTGSHALDCKGYSFTQVKIIDNAWDVLLGRGGQAMLVLYAYRLFGQVIKTLMRQGEVGYDVFSAVAFNSGSPYLVLQLARNSFLGWTPIPRTRHAMVAYLGMALATVYIIAMPSLFAAMTGYTSIYAPFLDDNGHGNSSKGLVDCYGTIQPVWGKHQALWPGLLNGWQAWSREDPSPIISKGVPTELQIGGPTWIDYYERYRSVYDTCPSQYDLSDCPEANKNTHILQPWRDEWDALYNITILAPMPGIIPYKSVSTTPSQSTHWLCAEDVFKMSDLNKRDKGGRAIGLGSGICRAGGGFAWGFSFLLTFIVCMFNLIFVLIMYALWIDVRWHRLGSEGASQFKDAAMMIKSAQRQYGEDVVEWSAAALQKDVVKGNVGITLADEKDLRKKPGMSGAGNGQRDAPGKHEDGDYIGTQRTSIA